MFLINFNQWKCACVGINNLVILLRVRYKCNHESHAFISEKKSKKKKKKTSVLDHFKVLGVKVTNNAIKSGATNKYSTLPRRRWYVNE